MNRNMNYEAAKVVLKAARKTDTVGLVWYNTYTRSRTLKVMFSWIPPGENYGRNNSTYARRKRAEIKQVHQQLIALADGYTHTRGGHLYRFDMTAAETMLVKKQRKDRQRAAVQTELRRWPGYSRLLNRAR